MAERVMIFIDGSNLYHSLKNHIGRTDIDIGKFCDKLTAKRQLIRIYYYNAKVGLEEEPERYKAQQSFFDSVNTVPYSELRLGRLVYNNWPNTPPYEKGTDVQLATDMITHNFKNNYDVAILVAGDNDYVGAVQAVKDNGKHVEVALFGSPGTSKNLRDAADKVIPLNAKILKDCWSKHGYGYGQARQHQPEQQPQTQAQPQAQPQPHPQPHPQPQPQPHPEPQQHQTEQQQPEQQRPEQPRPKPRRQYRRKKQEQPKKTNEGENQDNRPQR